MSITRWSFVVFFLFVMEPLQSIHAKPTIVVFLADDHGQFDSTPYGSPDARTPNLQRLASAGMTFDRAFVASPSCAPSRTAMLTGLMPARNGAEANHTFKRDDVASLPEVLRELGYETAAFGKVAHGKSDVARHGFDYFEAEHDAKTVGDYLTKRASSKPLCLFVGTHAPHVPWPENIGYDPLKVSLHPKFVDTPITRQQFTKYLSGVTQADSDLGSIYDLVNQRFSADETIFIYTSDHGGQWPFGKWNLYDSGIRVPFVAVWPSVIASNTRSNAIIQWIDLWPTLIDLAGGSIPTEIDGQSFLGVLRGKTKSHRSEIFATHSGDGDKNIYPIRAIRTDQFKYILNIIPDKSHTTHIDRGGGSGDGWRYFDEWVDLAKTDSKAAERVAAYHRRPAEELYDLQRDPAELNNLASDPQYAQELSALKSRLEAWMQAQGDKRTVFETPRTFDEPYPDRTIPVPPAKKAKKN